MNVSLTKELEALVEEKVKSGLYSTASEVIREALRQFQEHEQYRQFRLEQLRKEIAIGLADIERGDVAPMDLEAIKAEGLAILKRKR